jgi:hypothetical protein
MEMKTRTSTVPAVNNTIATVSSKTRNGTLEKDRPTGEQNRAEQNRTEQN